MLSSLRRHCCAQRWRPPNNGVRLLLQQPAACRPWPTCGRQRAVRTFHIIHTSRPGCLVPRRQIGARRGAAGDELHPPVGRVQGGACVARHLAQPIQLQRRWAADVNCWRWKAPSGGQECYTAAGQHAVHRGHSYRQRPIRVRMQACRQRARGSYMLIMVTRCWQLQGMGHAICSAFWKGHSVAACQRLSPVASE